MVARGEARRHGTAHGPGLPVPPACQTEPRTRTARRVRTGCVGVCSTPDVLLRLRSPCAAQPQATALFGVGRRMADFSMESTNTMHQEDDFTSMAPVSRAVPRDRPAARGSRVRGCLGSPRAPSCSCAAGGARTL